MTSRRSSVDHRSAFETDLSRLTHCFAFRRLQGKMQVLGLEASDFHRSRLTHSLEVAQIGRGICTVLRKKYLGNEEIELLIPDRDLIDTICLSHDLGHPPFGHAGERALNKCLLGTGHSIGFEGNGQTFRILTHLESHAYPHGLNLTRRALLGVLKYPVKFSDVRSKDCNFKPPKAYYDEDNKSVEWILEALNNDDQKKFQQFDPIEGSHSKAKYKSFDCSIMELADDISYALHDFEDGVFLGLINRSHLEDSVFGELLKSLNIEEVNIDNLVSDRMYQRKKSIGSLIHKCINSISIKRHGQFTEPLLDFFVDLSPECRYFLEHLNQNVVFKNLVKNKAALALELKGKKMVTEVFNAFTSEHELVPNHGTGRIVHKSDKSELEKSRAIADFIAGMTDEFLTRTYERLFIPRAGSVFDRI